MTLAEYFDTPETLVPQELIYGALRVADAPFVHHQRAVLSLALALERHVSGERLGEVLVAPVDVVLDAERALVLQPDLLFVSRARSDIVRDRVYGAPDLVIEVLSPRPRIGALNERVEWFARYGVREIWLYDQAKRRMHVLVCRDGQVVRSAVLVTSDRVRSGVLPALALAVEQLTAREI
ncbi:MAG TPA: Uma2 family endonuclease [Vicinamibacterales bacterium]|nr:Uma2 family endonuclease [Vicinamibacterales bacterium]